MKLCLAMMIQNERHWLECHLPTILHGAAIDGIVALDGGSDDASASTLEVLVNGRYPLQIGVRRFAWDFGAQANALVELAETLGYDALIRLDPDEAVFPAIFQHVKDQLTPDVPGLCFPRFNFIYDRLHYELGSKYPDHQFRAWWLHRGVRYTNAVHEMPVNPQNYHTWHKCWDHIYHYALVAPNDARLFLKCHNYNLLAQGQAPLTELPAGFVVPQGFADHPATRFPYSQPISPLEVGLHAPFEEVLS